MPQRTNHRIQHKFAADPFRLHIRIAIMVFIANTTMILGGCAIAPHSSQHSKPLFSIKQVQGQLFEESLLAGLRQWAVAHPHALGFSGDVKPRLGNLSLGPQTFRNKGISIVRFTQKYRDLPIHGDDQHIALVVANETDVVKIHGKFVNEKQTFRGYKNRITRNQAVQAMRFHWASQVAPGNVIIDNIRQVAVAKNSTVAFMGDVSTPIFSLSRQLQGSILADAESGSFLSIENRPAKAEVRGFELDDNPFTQTLVLHDGLPAKQLNNTVHFEPHPALDCQPPSWVNIRMGDATRHAVTNWEGTDGSTVSHFSVGRCSSGSPEESFLDGGIEPDGTVGLTTYAQDLFVKAQKAMAAIDPLMGDLVTHGGTHPYTWNHHPHVSSIAHRAPVVTVVNSSWIGSHAGVFEEFLVAQVDVDALDLPVPHPLVFYCRDSDGNPISCDNAEAGPPMQRISMVGVGVSFPFQTRILFHEMGHYYDNYNAHGVSGDNAEIIGQLFALFLHRKLYPDIDYKLTTVGLNGTCDLGILIGHAAGTVVHPDCVNNLDQIAQSINVTDQGYSIKSFTQAFWSLLFSVSCTLNGNVVNCDVPNSLYTNYEDRWMEALLFALQLGNEQSHVELWDNMALFIETNYPSEVERLQVVRELHGLDS